MGIMSDLSLRLSANTAELKNGLNQAKGDLKNFSSAVQSAADKITSSFKDINASTSSIKEMRNALKSLNNISFAGKSVEEIKAINMEIGRLKDEMGDMKAIQKGMGTEFTTLSLKAVQGIGAVTEVVFGAATMFGVSKEKAAQYQQTMTSMIGVMQGLAAITQLMEEKTLTLLWMRIKETAATVAQTVATKAAAVGQWLLNTAMSANPISLIVLGIAALVAGLKLAYDKSEAFRAIVLRVWGAIKGFGIALKDYVVDKIKDIVYGLGVFGSAISSLFSGEFKKAVSEAKEGFKVMFGMSESPPVVDAIEEITDKTDKNTTKIKENTKAFKEGKDAWEEYMKAVHAPSNPLTDITFGDMGAEGGPKMESKGAGTVKSDKKSNSTLTPKVIKQQTEALRDFNKELFSSQTASDIATQGIIGLGDAIIAMTTDGASAFKGMVTALLGGLRQIINGLLAQAIAAMIAKESTKGLLGLITASVGIAGVMALWSKVKFANGGIVPGSSYSGDKVPVLANSGEMILNGSQQGKLFSMINYGSNSQNRRGGQVEFEIKGDKLVGVLNNYGQKLNKTR